MGFFNKKEKVSFEKLLDFFVLMTIKQWETYQELFKMFLKNAGENENINNRQKEEILIFSMLEMTTVIKKVFNSELLLDAFHEIISDKVSLFEGNKNSFKITVIERYSVYQKILSEGGDSMVFNLGKQFADYLLDKDCMDIPLINFCGKGFFLSVSNSSEFFKDFINKYEIGN